MKTISIYRKLFTGTALVVLAVSFSSCEKNTIDPSGQFNIKVVNAASAFGAAKFYTGKFCTGERRVEFW